MRGLRGTRMVRDMVLVGGAVLLAVRALAGSYEVREYDSPMTVETSFALADPALWGPKQWHSSPDYEHITASICEHVKITKLEMSVEQLPKPRAKKGEAMSSPEVVKLWIRGKVKNDFGGDKLATMRFEVLNGAEVAATVNVKVSVEDAEERGFKGFASVPASVIPSDPAARMRITMNVELD
jgi:hypothetical protein